MKKVTALCLVAGLVLMAAPQVHAADDTKIIATHGEKVNLHAHAPLAYTDIEGHFAKDSIVRLSDMGMLKTKGEKAFNPNAKIDRSEFKQWLKTAVGKDVVDAQAANDVTRLQAAKWLADSLPAINTGIVGPNNLPYPYTDTPNITADEKEALVKLYQSGIMLGDGYGHFNPDATLTRGESAVLLSKAQQYSMQAATKVSFELQSGQLPETVNTVADENRTEPGLYTVVEGDTRYLIVNAGQVPTTGYSVSITKVTETDAGIFVEADLNKPDPGMMQGQVIMYPNAVLKIKDLQKPVYLYEQ